MSTVNFSRDKCYWWGTENLVHNVCDMTPEKKASNKKQGLTKWLREMKKKKQECLAGLDNKYNNRKKEEEEEEGIPINGPLASELIAT